MKSKLEILAEIDRLDRDLIAAEARFGLSSSPRERTFGLTAGRARRREAENAENAEIADPVDRDTLRQLGDFESAHDAGDGLALFDAIVLSHLRGIELPRWAAETLAAGYTRLISGEVASLDDAFGRPFKKGAHLASLRLRRRLMFDVWNATRELIDAGTAIDDELFEKIGCKFQIGRTLAKDIYYESEAAFAAMLPRP